MLKLRWTATKAVLALLLQNAEQPDGMVLLSFVLRFATYIWGGVGIALTHPLQDLNTVWETHTERGVSALRSGVNWPFNGNVFM